MKDEKHTKLFDEIEVYETSKDRLYLAGVILAVIVIITLLVDPHLDVEIIGQWIHKHL